MKLYYSQSISINFHQLSLILILCIYSSGFYAQNNGNNGQGVLQWKTNGNIADSNHFIGTKNEFPVKFRTNDTERFRITSDGNIGIGTSLPQAKLDVIGDVIFRNAFKLPGLYDADSSIQNFLLIKNDGTVSKGGLDHLKSLMYLDGTSSDGSCGDGGIYNDPNPTWANGLNKIYYKCPQIKVGIGTQNPNFTLHVIGKTYSLEYQGNKSIINQGIFNQRLLVGTDVINTNYSLNVNGNSFVQGTFFVKNSSNITAINVDLTGASDYTKIIYAEVQNPTTEIIKVVNTQTNHTPFLLSSSGKMEIHNGTKKIFQLETDGLLRTRRIRVDAESWADFVFAEEYDLMPLSEVKNYISSNFHLPSVPSESEVKENGVDLLEMNKILLQKIEELTLYLIEQNDENKSIKDDLKRLEDKISLLETKN